MKKFLSTLLFLVATQISCMGMQAKLLPHQNATLDRLLEQCHIENPHAIPLLKAALQHPEYNSDDKDAIQSRLTFVNWHQGDIVGVDRLKYANLAYQSEGSAKAMGAAILGIMSENPESALELILEACGQSDNTDALALAMFGLSYHQKELKDQLTYLEAALSSNCHFDVKAYIIKLIITFLSKIEPSEVESNTQLSGLINKIELKAAEIIAISQKNNARAIIDLSNLFLIDFHLLKARFFKENAVDELLIAEEIARSISKRKSYNTSRALTAIGLARLKLNIDEEKGLSNLAEAARYNTAEGAKAARVLCKVSLNKGDEYQASCHASEYYQNATDKERAGVFLADYLPNHYDSEPLYKRACNSNNPKVKAKAALGLARCKLNLHSVDTQDIVSLLQFALENGSERVKAGSKAELGAMHLKNNKLEDAEAQLIDALNSVDSIKPNQKSLTNLGYKQGQELKKRIRLLLLQTYTAMENLEAAMCYLDGATYEAQLNVAKLAFNKKEYHCAKSLLEDIKKQTSLDIIRYRPEYFSACCHLTLIYYQGLGYPADLVKAEESFNALATERLHPNFPPEKELPDAPWKEVRAYFRLLEINRKLRSLQEERTELSKQLTLENDNAESLSTALVPKS